MAAVALGLFVVVDDAEAGVISATMSYSDLPAGAIEIQATFSFDTTDLLGFVCIAGCQNLPADICTADLRESIWVDESVQIDDAAGIFIPDPSSGDRYVLRGFSTFGILTANDFWIPKAFKVTEMDPDHCRVIGDFVTHAGTPIVVHRNHAGAPRLFAPGWGTPDRFDIEWTAGCCRTEGAHHPNNGDGVNMRLTVPVRPASDQNSGPRVDFQMLAPPGTPLSEKGYGNIHCQADTLCRFRVVGTDADGDTLEYRLATEDEAGFIQEFNFPFCCTYSEPFQHPGTDCGGCATGPFGIDATTGLVTWDTQGTTEGEIWSTQFIIEDGKTQTPVDVIIEIFEPPEPCWDGSLPVTDPVTGEVTCPDPPPLDCPPGTYRKDPGNPYSECLFPPEEEYQPVRGEPRPKSPFWLPEPSYPETKDPARSDVHHGHAHAHDRVNEAIARLDQDGDGVRDRDDLCLDDALTQEQDLDGDGIGDACDGDMDGDGVENALDPCSFDPGDVCVKPSAPPETQALGTATVGDLLAGSAAPEDRGGAEKVHVASVAPSKSPAGSIMLAVLGGALLLLLLAIAVGRRDA